VPGEAGTNVLFTTFNPFMVDPTGLSVKLILLPSRHAVFEEQTKEGVTGG
jgi:hypothetical protein